VGIALITWGADALIDGIADISKELGLSGVILAILVMGVDLEETIASISAARSALQDIAVGNVIGNSLISMTLSFALPGLLYGISIHKIKSVYLWLMASISFLVFLGILWWPQMKVFAILVLIFYAIFVLWNLLNIKKTKPDVLHIEEDDNVIDLLSEEQQEQVDVNIRKTGQNDDDVGVDADDVGNDNADADDVGNDNADADESLFLPIFLSILGFLAVFFGSDLLIANSKEILAVSDLTEGFFGVIIIAAATNVEEYALLFRSIKKKSVEVGLGAMIGKVIWNLGITFGISVLLLPNVYHPSGAILLNSILLTFIVCPFFILLAVKSKRLSRFYALILLVLFIGYIMISFWFM